MDSREVVEADGIESQKTEASQGASAAVYFVDEQENDLSYHKKKKKKKEKKKKHKRDKFYTNEERKIEMTCFQPTYGSEAVPDAVSYVSPEHQTVQETDILPQNQDLKQPNRSSVYTRSTSVLTVSSSDFQYISQDLPQLDARSEHKIPAVIERPGLRKRTSTTHMSLAASDEVLTPPKNRTTTSITETDDVTRPTEEIPVFPKQPEIETGGATKSQKLDLRSPAKEDEETKKEELQSIDKRDIAIKSAISSKKQIKKDERKSQKKTSEKNSSSKGKPKTLALSTASATGAGNVGSSDTAETTTGEVGDNAGEKVEQDFKLCGRTCKAGTGSARVFQSIRSAKPFVRMWKFVKEAFKTRPHLFIVLVAVLLLVLFVILFPVSLVYVHYHEIALRKTISTGYIGRDTVYYSGCYVLGPNTEFIKYSRSAHIERLELSVFTSDRLELNVDISFMYFLRAEELGTLDGKYRQEYKTIFTNIAVSTLKNEMIAFSLEDLLHERSHVELTLHTVLHRKFAGSCCMTCCDTGSCDMINQNITALFCTECDASSACESNGLHADVRYLQLLEVHPPAVIAERLLSAVLRQVDMETALFQQQVVIQQRETERQVQAISNHANEVLESGVATANQIISFANSNASLITQNATTTGFYNMSQALAVSQEEHLNSLFYINTMSRMENLIFIHNYNGSGTRINL